ncbi:MAG: hypothetical protein VW882_08695, partial [Gammaproteobacteria bacterium]
MPTNTTKTTYAEDNRSQVLSTNTSTIAMVDLDNYGNVLKSIHTLNDGFSTVKTTTTRNYHSANTSSWWVNKLNYQTVKTETLNPQSNYPTYDATLDGVNEIKTTTTWTSYRQPDVVTTQALLGGGATISVDTNYNNYGLPTTITTTELGKPSRTVAMTYSDNGTSASSAGYFVYSAKNALNHETITKTDPGHGQAIEVTDANGLSSTMKYDAFGRVEQVSPPVGAGQPVYTRYSWCSGSCDGISNTNLVYKVSQYSAGTPDSHMYKDMMNRELFSSVESFSGAETYLKKTYDYLGRPLFESIPSNTHNVYTGTYFTYNHTIDPLGRMTQKQVAQATGTMTVNYDYNGSTTEITVYGSTHQLDMSRTYSGSGRLMSTTDALNGITRYAYDSMGNPTVIEDANTNKIKASYNAFGQKSYVDDPNMGMKSFTYEYGAVKSELDANGKTTAYTLDKLNRVSERRVNGSLEAQFFFDSECKGLVDSEVSHNLYSGSFQKQYDYDNYCRLTHDKHIIDGSTYTMEIEYDGNYGRPKGTHYPTGLVVASEYNDDGYLQFLKNAADGYVYEEIVTMSHWGKVTQAYKADGELLENTGYTQNTGQMESIEANATFGGTQRHKITYEYDDDFGNLTKQTIYNTSTNTSIEDYEYDKLHRLKRADRWINGNFQTPMTFNYDAVGNLTYKSDFAYSFAYGNANRSLNNAGPNAVRYVAKTTLGGGGSTTYAYDNNGNMTSGDGRTITYNAFNKPLTIANYGVTSRFYYGPDQMRFKQVKTGAPGGTQTTLYVGKSYEKITVGTEVQEKVYFGDTIVTKTTGGSSPGTELSFMHRDRLGSVVTVTDVNGDVVDNKSYDAFGKPRKGDMTLVSPATLTDIVQLTPSFETKTTRGFTEHEHLDDAALIHMNGRAYDYNLGRFLSV